MNIRKHKIIFSYLQFGERIFFFIHFIHRLFNIQIYLPTSGYIKRVVRIYPCCVTPTTIHKTFDVKLFVYKNNEYIYVKMKKNIILIGTMRNKNDKKKNNKIRENKFLIIKCY